MFHRMTSDHCTKYRHPLCEGRSTMALQPRENSRPPDLEFSKRQRRLSRTSLFITVPKTHSIRAALMLAFIGRVEVCGQSRFVTFNDYLVSLLGCTGPGIRKKLADIGDGKTTKVRLRGCFAPSIDNDQITTQWSVALKASQRQCCCVAKSIGAGNVSI